MFTELDSFVTIDCNVPVRTWPLQTAFAAQWNR